MADLINGVDSEVLTFHDSDNIPYIQNIESVISSGAYVKLTNREYIFIDMGNVYNTLPVIPQPSKYGYINNTTTLNFTVEYYEE